MSTTYTQQNINELHQAIQTIVQETPITDMHTHLYAPDFGELLLFGIDELLTYHYLIAEFFRMSTMSYDEFWALDKAGQAEAIWECLFIENSPISEACRGVLTVLEQLGLDTTTRDLQSYRAYFDAQEPSAFIDTVYESANLASTVMTNDPFDDLERPVWEQGYPGDRRFHAALRIDPLLNQWEASCKRLLGWGYNVEPGLNDTTLSEIRRFLDEWMTRMDALYMAVSLPPEFAYPEDSARAKILEHCILPVAKKHNRPFAMMIGVTRQVNPQLRLAGDSLGKSAMAPVEALCAQFPENKFMVTMLTREDQHELSVTARKFRNLLIFGCWWFLNNPSLIEEMTRMRIELLGPSIMPQHSDARVLDQVIYKWAHSRQIITKVLCDKYTDLVNTGWEVAHGELKRDIERLLGGNFWRFVDLTL